ncbi:hypothetical protein WJX72_005972 [[Myrmecia] bisecta]|uniref:Aminotransferase class I/classII large domain-containing protein n=1 Tax=[Myrmecia] bisecta TaxID=41462 RepID=A0AAW1PDY0_9CHLO
MTLRDGSKVEITDPAKVSAAQQYSTVLKGYPGLQEWAHAHTWAQHSPPGAHEVMVTGGSNHTLEIIFSLLLNRGDPLLCEEYTYPHVVESFMNMKGYKAMPVSIDQHGIVPSALRATLEARKESGAQMPRLMYTVPIGQNPTGAITPVSRRRQIYDICRTFDVVIIEDDPYYYLQFAGAGCEPLGLNNLGQSYLSMDTDNRVIRLDSFAKVLAPGVRLGWVTAAPAMIEKIIFCLHGSTLGPCSSSQVMVAEMLRVWRQAGLAEHVMVAEMLRVWGQAGLEAHVRNMQSKYAHRAQVIHDAAAEHLAGLAEWSRPQAGMFMWMRLGAGVTDADQILDLLKEERVVVVPGRIAHCKGPHPGVPCPYVRVSYASAADEDLKEGMRRLANVLRAFQQNHQSPATSNGNHK